MYGNAEELLNLHICYKTLLTRSRSWKYLMESAEQKQPAHTHSLILLCTIRWFSIIFRQRKPIQRNLKNSKLMVLVNYIGQQFEITPSNTNPVFPAMFHCLHLFCFVCNLHPYSQNILKNVLSLVLRIFLNWNAYESNPTSDYLNRLWFSPSEVVFQFTKLWKKTECSKEWLVKGTSVLKFDLTHYQATKF